MAKKVDNSANAFLSKMFEAVEKIAAYDNKEKSPRSERDKMRDMRVFTRFLSKYYTEIFIQKEIFLSDKEKEKSPQERKPVGGDEMANNVVAFYAFMLMQITDPVEQKKLIKYCNDAYNICDQYVDNKDIPEMERYLMTSILAPTSLFIENKTLKNVEDIVVTYKEGDAGRGFSESYSAINENLKDSSKFQSFAKQIDDLYVSAANEIDLEISQENAIKKLEKFITTTKNFININTPINLYLKKNLLNACEDANDLIKSIQKDGYKEDVNNKIIMITETNCPKTIKDLEKLEEDAVKKIEILTTTIDNITSQHQDIDQNLTSNLKKIREFANNLAIGISKDGYNEKNHNKMVSLIEACPDLAKEVREQLPHNKKILQAINNVIIVIGKLLKYKVDKQALIVDPKVESLSTIARDKTWLTQWSSLKEKETNTAIDEVILQNAKKSEAKKKPSPKK